MQGRESLKIYVPDVGCQLERGSRRCGGCCMGRRLHAIKQLVYSICTTCTHYMYPTDDAGAAGDCLPSPNTGGELAGGGPASAAVSSTHPRSGWWRPPGSPAQQTLPPLHPAGNHPGCLPASSLGSPPRGCGSCCLGACCWLQPAVVAVLLVCFLFAGYTERVANRSALQRACKHAHCSDCAHLMCMCRL